MFFCRLTIQRTAHASPTFIEDVSVDHRGPDIFVTQQLLDGTNVISVFQKVSCKAVPKRVTASILFHAGRAQACLHGALYVLLSDMMPSRLS